MLLKNYFQKLIHHIAFKVIVWDDLFLLRYIAQYILSLKKYPLLAILHRADSSIKLSDL